VDITKDTSGQFAQKSMEVVSRRQFGIIHLSINTSKLEIMNSVKLNIGIEMPVLGFGIYHLYRQIALRNSFCTSQKKLKKKWIIEKN